MCAAGRVSYSSGTIISEVVLVVCAWVCPSVFPSDGVWMILHMSAEPHSCV